MKAPAPARGREEIMRRLNELAVKNEVVAAYLNVYRRNAVRLDEVMVAMVECLAQEAAIFKESFERESSYVRRQVVLREPLREDPWPPEVSDSGEPLRPPWRRG